MRRGLHGPARRHHQRLTKTGVIALRGRLVESRYAFRLEENGCGIFDTFRTDGELAEPLSRPTCHALGEVADECGRSAGR
jgi:hypothetical protein